MLHKNLRVGACVALIIGACMMVEAADPPLPAEKLLHSFTGGNDGSEPDAGLTLDSAGNLYGSTFFGGSTGNGVIFKLVRSTSGTKETVLYTFKGGATDGANPSGQLAINSSGVIFGTTSSGGKGNGILFELIPSSGKYVEKVLHVFGTGQTPVNAGVIIDRAGNLYGETAGGGSATDGTIYEMKRTSTGYNYVLLYSFKGGSDGNYPEGGLIFDAAGNLYGTTEAGGGASGGNAGTVFELKHNANGTWTEKVLYAFTGAPDGVNPVGALAFDKSGNLYGATASGGDLSCGGGYGCGEVFELMNSGGVWTKTALHEFTDTPDGHAPQAGVTFDSAGNLFGTTINGGSDGTGALFELTPVSGGWRATVIHSFTNGADGGYPATPVIFDSNGNLFGTAQFGGTYTWGAAFEFSGVK